MSVNQAFNINTRDEVLGQIYGIHYSAKVVDSWELEGANVAPYGSVLVRTGDRKCETATQANLTGTISIAAFAARQARQEQGRAAIGDVLGSDGNSDYAVGNTVPAMRFGSMQALAGEALALTDPVYYNPTDHKFYNDIAGGGTAYLVDNAVFDSTAAADGDIVRVRIITMV